mgnify:CR=1 FL=1
MVTVNEGVLKCLHSAINVLGTEDNLTDFQAMLMRDLEIMSAQLLMYMNTHATTEELPLTDNVVEFKLKGVTDEEV